MNITDHIVNFLREGHSVELPHFGTFATQRIAAHFDGNTNTFYPTRDIIEFSNSFANDESFVNYLSEKECVTLSTAQQMWRNYVDVLSTRFQEENAFTLPEIGTLTRGEGGFEWQVDENLNLCADTSFLKPIEKINSYAPKTQSDPFAVFEQPLRSIEEYERENNPQPEPVPAEEPVAEEPSVPQVEEVPVEETVIEEQTIPQPEAIPVEEKPEEEPIVDDNPVQYETVPQSEEESLNNEVVESSPVSPIPTEEKPAVKPEAVEPVAEPEPEEIIPDLEYIDHEDVPAPVAETVRQEESKPTPEVLENLENLEQLESISNISSNPEQESKPKKKKKWGLWMLLILLLLGLGAGAYYYFMIRPSQPAQPKATEANAMDIEQMVSESEGTENLFINEENENSEEGDADLQEEEISQEVAEETSAEEETTPEPKAQNTQSGKSARVSSFEEKTFPFTYSTELLEFNEEDIRNNTAEVMRFMDNYISNFAASKHYTGATEGLKSQVRDYVEYRLSKLFKNEGFSVERFFNNNGDYIRNHCMDVLKGRRANQARCAIQTELMDDATLMQMLTEVVNAQGVEADAQKAVQPAAAPAPKKTVTSAPTAKASKQGFDIIAGFYVNKSSADKMTNILKSKGCDAYIIDCNGLYYVSMGSAPDRTKAEALYNHIKEWYQGDIAIKKW